MTTVEYTYCDDLISDLHKDAYGYRPREGFFQRWQEATPAEKQEQWDWLCQVVERVLEEEAAQEKVSVACFEELVAETISLGAGDRETALRWIMEGSICNGDWEFLCYEYGLPYGYFKKVA